MRLYLVRHADAEPGEPDELRRLTPEGREAARRVGARLAAEGVAASAVLTSPLLRARQTGDEIAHALGIESEPDERLAPGATAEDVRTAVAERGDVVVAVAHQPDCGRIAAELIGGAEPSFRPADFVELEL